jgi:hypothetical protein
MTYGATEAEWLFRKTFFVPDVLGVSSHGVRDIRVGVLLGLDGVYRRQDDIG